MFRNSLKNSSVDSVSASKPTHAATFFAQAQDATGSSLPRYVKDEFDSFLCCGILAHGFLRLNCDGCKQDQLLAFSCKRRGFCPSCGAKRMSATAAYLVGHASCDVAVGVYATAGGIGAKTTLPCRARRARGPTPRQAQTVLRTV
jgi:hypothetical protein